MPHGCGASQIQHVHPAREAHLSPLEMHRHIGVLEGLPTTSGSPWGCVQNGSTQSDESVLGSATI